MRPEISKLSASCSVQVICDQVGYMQGRLHSTQRHIFCVIVICSETEVQLRVVSETVNLREVTLDNVKQRGSVNDKQQGSQTRTMRYATVK